jgi:hypothetical protein
MVSSLRSVGGFYGVLVCSREFLALRWMTLKKVPGVGAMRCRLYLAAKARGVGPIRDCLVTVVGDGAFPRGCEAPRAWIFLAVLTV